MNYNHLLNCPYMYIAPAPTNYSYYVNRVSKKSKQVRKPNKSFYVHCQDALCEKLPACVWPQRKRYTCNARIIEQRHQAAASRRKQFLAERVARLNVSLAKVKLLSNKFHTKRRQSWLQMREHIVKDMQEHVQRHATKLMQRVAQLRLHNAEVQRMSELLRYRTYLEHMAKHHDEKRKRKGIF